MGGPGLERAENIIVITDANVLIDYAEVNIKVLRLLTVLFKEVRVPVDILNEVTELTEDKAGDFGLIVYYPEPDTYYKASNVINGISFQDNICRIDAQKNGWAVVTSDRKMKKKCEAEGVKTFWGLQVMLMLVMEGILLKKEAMITAEKICEINSRIGEKVLEDFKKKLLQLKI